MPQGTPDKSRSGKDQPNTLDDLSFDVVMHGSFRLSGRKLLSKAKKLKWPAITVGVVLCILYGQQFEVEIRPGSHTPVDISRNP
ncbi:hypothetical protein [Nocardia sp. MH4]|uniref:hypothetical protein n=1 Tax=Nocardia sp. MH4 TaxID=1768677 RepID=UPI001C4EFBC1|nr:hypothetical protein [Nocardia sp. MH4]